MTTVCLLIEGTFGGDWAKPSSRFCRLLRAQGLEVQRFEGWTLGVGGVPNLLSSGKHRDWIAGGYALADRIRLIRALRPGVRIVIVCHSHGLNVVLYGLIRGDVSIDRLISVCSPVRHDMQRQATGAAKRIGRWRHVASSGWDFWQWAGGIFDGVVTFRRPREWHQAHENRLLSHIGHAKLLRDRRHLSRWQTEGLLGFLREESRTCAGVAGD